MASYRSYVTGFIISLGLTLLAFYFVMYPDEQISPALLIAGVIGLALAQLAVQLIFFLHLGRQSKPRWNIVVFLFMLMVVVIVVGGSLWIMNNLNYHMQGHKAEEIIIKDEAI